jgi:hypothetical protein
VHYGKPIAADLAKELGEEGLVEEVRGRVCAGLEKLRRDPVFGGDGQDQRRRRP